MSDCESHGGTAHVETNQSVRKLGVKLVLKAVQKETLVLRHRQMQRAQRTFVSIISQSDPQRAESLP